MSGDSEGPGLSDAFHVGTTPVQMRDAILDLARNAERSKVVFKTHWGAITRIDSAVQVLAGDNLKLTQRVSSLEIRIALYAALGSFVGGTLVALLIKFAFH